MDTLKCIEMYWEFDTVAKLNMAKHSTINLNNNRKE
jgi:hypothetical protein